MTVTVCGSVMPVVDHIIKQVEATDGAVVAIHAATHAPVAAFAVYQQIVVPRTDTSVDGGSIAVVGAVGIVLMACNAQCLRDDIILECDVQCSATAYRLVGTPGSGAMVYDGVVGTTHAHCIARILAVDAQTAFETDMPANHVRADVDVRSLDTDAFARCRLSGNIGVRFDEVRIKIELNHTAHVEYDIARLVHLRQAVEQTAGFLAPAERRHVVHLAPSSAGSEAAIPLCTGKR